MEIILKIKKGILWWKKEETKTYVGECTVWYEKESGRRASTMAEGRLSEIWAQRMRER